VNGKNTESAPAAATDGCDLKRIEIIAFILCGVGILILRARKQYGALQAEWVRTLGIFVGSMGSIAAGSLAIARQWSESAWWGKLIRIVLYGWLVIIGLAGIIWTITRLSNPARGDIGKHPNENP
jgi:hypothetical protein